VDADYPKPLSLWRGLQPETTINAVVQVENFATYFFAGQHFYRFNDVAFNVRKRRSRILFPYTSIAHYVFPLLHNFVIIIIIIIIKHEKSRVTLIWVGSKHNLAKLQHHDVTLTVSTETIHAVDVVRNLGVWMDHELNCHVIIIIISNL